jgi:hypothetical protein
MLRKCKYVHNLKITVQLEVTPSWGAEDRLPSDRKSLLALWGVGPESEAESVRFRWRRVTKVGPEVNQRFFFRVALQ